MGRMAARPAWISIGVDGPGSHTDRRQTIVWGMSSWLVQVTSVPLLISNLTGEKVRLSIPTRPPTSDGAAAGSSKQVSKPGTK
jgi:hypothetical protein